jgi:hypothetical protein
MCPSPRTKCKSLCISLNPLSTYTYGRIRKLLYLFLPALLGGIVQKKTLSFYTLSGDFYHLRPLPPHSGLVNTCANNDVCGSNEANPYRCSIKPRPVGAIHETTPKTAHNKALSFLTFPGTCAQQNCRLSTMLVTAMRQNPYRFSMKSRLAGAIHGAAPHTAHINPYRFSCSWEHAPNETAVSHAP